LLLKERNDDMSGEMIVRVVAGVLFVILLVILIQRRRNRAK
jgi:hypothetical protein